MLLGPCTRSSLSDSCGYHPQPSSSDEELWVRFVRLECQASLKALHRRYFEPLHAWIRRCGVRDEARVADLFQDVWVRLVTNRHRFDPTMKWGTWAFHVAKNLARNEGRRLQRRFVTPEADFRIKDEETVQVRSADSSSLPEEMMRERQLAARLERVLAELTPEQRTIFTLRFIEGRSNEEVSHLLDIPLSALKAKAKRVRLKVLGEMQPLLEDSA
ncbi:MAG TPA: sigma-70 family RNA polymerase sigma factor [Longimicrobium sp.]